MNLKLSVAGKTDVGLVREQNEDYLVLDYDNNMFVICDGMGGHKAGEVASKEACDIIRYCFADLAETLNTDPDLAIPADLPLRGALLIKSIRLANRSVYRHSRSRSELTGMGTTVAAVAFEDDLVCVAHVGDSRVYRLRPERLQPLTTDHSWVAELQKAGKLTEIEAAQAVNRNVITRALGISEKVEVDFRADRLMPGDIFILCSDGLCGFADDDEIFSAAQNCAEDVNSIVNTLIQLANDHGGQDNVTVIAVRVDSVEGSADREGVTPVTVSVEDDATFQREIEILDTLKQPDEKDTLSPDGGKAEGKRLSLFLIFIAFIIIAAFIIYLTIWD